LPERAPDVLLVDERLGQSDPAVQRGVEPAGLEVICKQCEQLLWAVGAKSAWPSQPATGRCWH
jgi:hypothetical protein